MCGGGSGGGSSAAQNLMAVSQANIANRQQDMSERQYADSQKLVSTMTPLVEDAYKSATGVRDSALGLSNELIDRWRTSYRPVEDKAIDDAMNYDSASRLTQVAGQADASVMSAYDRAKKAAARDSLRLGINPNSGKALALAENGALGTAVAQAGASQAAMEDTRQAAIGLRQGLIQVGQNTLAAGQGAAGLGLSANNAGIGAYTNLASVQNAGFGSAMSGFNSAASTTAGASNTLGQIATANNQAAQVKSQEKGAVAGAAVAAGAAMFS